jgi:probable F420-dependent oxidoreductase
MRPTMRTTPGSRRSSRWRHLAAVTRRVRLAVGVIVLPQRQPVLLAKQLTSIDVLSEGRLIVGLGVGYLEAELRALGATLADRGARTDEYILAMRALWDEPPPDFEGRFVAFSNVIQRPRPAQRPHPPVVIGGESPAAYRRARAAGGWYAWESSPQQVADVREQLGASVEVTVTPAPPGPIEPDLARRYAEAGVDRLVLQPPDTTGASMDELIAATRDTLIGRV